MTHGASLQLLFCLEKSNRKSIRLVTHVVSKSVIIEWLFRFHESLKSNERKKRVKLWRSFDPSRGNNELILFMGDMVSRWSKTDYEGWDSADLITHVRRSLGSATVIFQQTSEAKRRQTKCVKKWEFISNDEKVVCGEIEIASQIGSHQYETESTSNCQWAGIVSSFEQTNFQLIRHYFDSI